MSALGADTPTQPKVWERGPGHFAAVNNWQDCHKLSKRARVARRGDIMQAQSAGNTPTRGQAGFTLIDLLFVMALIGLISTLAIPGIMRVRSHAQAGSALATIRVMNSAQLSYAITCGLGFYAPDLPTLGIKPFGAVDAFLPPDLSNGPVVMRTGYNFSIAITPIAGTPATCNGLAAGSTGPSYALVADPMGGEGRYFGTNADGVIYEHTASLAAIMPETGAPASGHPVK